MKTLYSLWGFFAASAAVSVAWAHPGHGEAPTAEASSSDAFAPVVLGSGDWTFETSLVGMTGPAGGTTLGQPTHGGVAVASDGTVYATLDGDEDGFIAFPPGESRGVTVGPGLANGHALVIREEEGGEFFYVPQPDVGRVVKATLAGEVVWTISTEDVLTATADLGLYGEVEGRKRPVRFKPTAVAVTPAGEIFVADGYGAGVIHRFDAGRNYVATVGSVGKGVGQFRNPHGVTVDTRFDPPRLVVADRENRRLQAFDLEGEPLGVIATGLRRPCATAIGGDYMAVAELQGRVTVLGPDDAVICHLGDNADESQWAKFPVPPEAWSASYFTSPHGVCFDGDDILVATWNKSGRLTRLSRVPGEN
ncbi:MAG: hypothetical protein AAGJ97_10500 [Planctomycetota bacterium]